MNSNFLQQTDSTKAWNFAAMSQGTGPRMPQQMAQPQGMPQQMAQPQGMPSLPPLGQIGQMVPPMGQAMQQSGQQSYYLRPPTQQQLQTIAERGDAHAFGQILENARNQMPRTNQNMTPLSMIFAMPRFDTTYSSKSKETVQV